MIFVSMILMSCEKEKVLDPETDVPNVVQNYISTHFPNSKIVKVIKEVDNTKKKLKIRLEEGTSLTFNNKDEIIEIESKRELPQSVVPEKIWDYVEGNYPNNHIIEWELDGNKQDVDLDNGLQLEFNLNGDFVRIDS